MKKQPETNPKFFIEQQKKLYKKLKSCYCPAIQNTIHFNAEGLKHLLYDNKHRPRKIKEKIYKIALVDYLVEVIENAPKATLQSFSNPPSEVWALSWFKVNKIGKKGYFVIKVILRRKGNGKIHFLSVMRKPIKATNKKPTQKRESFCCACLPA